MKRRDMRAILAATMALASFAVGGSLFACDDGGAVRDDPGGYAPTPVSTGTAAADGGAVVDGGGQDCVQNPETHLEIINACTDAVKIDKASHPPLLLADGGLPPIP